MVSPQHKAELLLVLSYARTSKCILRIPFNPLAFNTLFPVFCLGSSGFGIKYQYERPGYLVTFGPLNLIIGMRYADASQDLFDPYSETASMCHPPIGRKW